MKKGEFSKEDVDKFVEACNKFGATIEESARIIKIMEKKPTRKTNLTPKQYGMKLRK